MKFHQALMATAHIWSELSHCKRRKVGAVLSKNRRVLATSYNGAIPGENNDCEDANNNTIEGISHAEQGVLMYAAKNGISTDGCTMYITLSPCITCARLMIQAGIERVFYTDEYRDVSGIALLLKHGIAVQELK